MNRDDAQKALALGFRKDTLLALRHHMKPGFEGRFVFGHVYAVYGAYCDIHFYTNSRPVDVERSFYDDMRNCDQEVVAYADGSGTAPDKPAGIGVAVYRPWTDLEMVSECIGLGTNNRAELCAAWRALRACPVVNQRLLIRTDSEYTIGSLTKHWSAQKNAGLIANIRADLARRPNVRFEHVSGHAGVAGNEVADLLAKIGRKWLGSETIYEGD